MVIIGGLGTSFLIATTMGKTWKHWGGNFALAAGASIFLGTLNRKHGNRWQCALLLSIALMSCKYALQQHRNPSLILKPYLIHGIANAVLCTANQKIYEKNLLGLSKDKDVKSIYFSVSTLCLSYLLAKGIQNKMGAKSLKINWKVESLTQRASLAVLLFAGSKRSPIYED